MRPTGWIRIVYVLIIVSTLYAYVGFSEDNWLWFTMWTFQIAYNIRTVLVHYGIWAKL